VIASFRNEWLWAFFVDDAVAAEFRGELAGLHSIRVNDRWRLIFHWDGGWGEAKSVYLDDHSYR
jgi:plasmid maintenance system killer protein